MKKIYMTLTLLLATLSMFAQTYKLGDFALGGIVFSIDESGKHGLVCAKFDQLEYCDLAEALTACEGFQNMENGKTYDDWRLPTKDEIALIQKNKTVIDATALAHGGVALDSELGSYYWSSTVEYGTHAWLQSFGFGFATLMAKESNSFVARAVRDF